MNGQPLPQALVGLPTAEQEAILRRAARYVLPQPFEAPALPPQGTPERQLLDELAASADVRLDSATMEEKGRLAEMLAAHAIQIIRPAADSRRAIDAKERLAVAGDLPIRSFQLVFDPAMAEFYAKGGLSDQLMRETVLAPLAVEHLRLGKREGPPPVTLVTRFWEPPAVQAPSTILVQGGRMKESELFLSQAWHLPEAIFGSLKSTSPMDALMKFISHYGLEFRLGDHPPTKFASYDAVNARPGVDPLEVNVGSSKEFVAYGIRRFIRGLAVVEAYFTYVIDLEHYYADLRRLGLAPQGTDRGR